MRFHQLLADGKPEPARRSPTFGVAACERNVLAEIADNTAAVWDWAPPRTPVRGCLVLDQKPHRNQYDYGKGPVVVHTPETLARELKAESEHSRELEERVANTVRGLGSVSG